jgi:hypothetical protein
MALAKHQLNGLIYKTDFIRSAATDGGVPEQFQILCRLTF